MELRPALPSLLQELLRCKERSLGEDERII